MIEHAICLLQAIGNSFCCQDDGSCFVPPWMNKFFEQWKNERTFSLRREDFKIVAMKDAIEIAVEKAGIIVDLITTGVKYLDTLDPLILDRRSKINIDTLNQEILGIRILNEDGSYANFGAVINLLFEHIAEPFLTEDYRTEDEKLSCPVFITEYPSEICPLARKNDDNPEVCDRFELFLDGKEIANAFQELNDPDEQELRFKEQLESNKKDPMDLDSNYIDALRCGLPPTIGFGLGLDRAVMMLTCSKSIRDVIAFARTPKNCEF